MGLAKRLEEQVLDGRMTEAEAEEIMDTQEALWTGKETDGQMLLTSVIGKTSR